MVLGTIGTGILTAMGLARVSYSASGKLIHHTAFSQGLRSPLFQGGGFGVGYTGGAYLGYGTTNTADPFGLHKPKYRRSQQSLGLPYGTYGRRRYSRYPSRYSGYTRYSRRSYYRRRRPYYRRRSYY
ncbi:MAG TPA: hypothetical protein EYN67_18145 [Flavobacteriales bacterium]|nr:hypothetical protein [Flavobacteriales bacterium]